MRLGGAWPFLSKRRKVSHHQDVSSSAYRPLRQSIRYLKIELCQIVHIMEAEYAVSLSGLFGRSGAHMRQTHRRVASCSFVHFGNGTAAGPGLSLAGSTPTRTYNFFEVKTQLVAGVS